MLPIKPILTEPVLQELLAFEMPTDIALQTPVFSGVLPLEPANTATSVLPFVYAAYANTLQDIIDGKIVDTLGYNIPSDILTGKWRFLKDEILRKYNKTRTEFLNNEGKRNHTSMPGSTKKKLMELSIEERRELSASNIKLYQENTALTYEQIETALKGSLESDAIRFDSHHKLQIANFEVASSAVKASFDILSADIEKYNQKLSAIEAEIEKSKAELTYQSQLLDKYAIEIKMAGLQVNHENLLLEAYRVGVEYLTEQAKMDLIFYQSYLIEAELEKNKIVKYGLEVDQFAALINAITAEYEVYYAGAKKIRADYNAYKERLGVTRANLRVKEAELKGSELLANARLDQANAQLQVNHDLLRVIEEELDTLAKQIQAELTEKEADNIDDLRSHATGNAGQILEWFDKAREALRTKRGEAAGEINAGQEIASQTVANAHAAAINSRSSYANSTRRARALAAAMAEVVSRFIHVAAGGG